jgi:two-component system response regulator
MLQMAREYKPQPKAGSILLVEDDLGYVPLIQIAMEQAGIHNPVEVVTDGREALDYLFGRGEFSNRGLHPFPALVMLDLRLPRLNGFEVLQTMRQNSETRDVPVIVFTGSEVPQEASRAGQLGITAYMVKPFEFHDLVRFAESLHTYGF